MKPKKFDSTSPKSIRYQKSVFKWRKNFQLTGDFVIYLVLIPAARRQTFLIRRRKFVCEKTQTRPQRQLVNFIATRHAVKVRTSCRDIITSFGSCNFVLDAFSGDGRPGERFDNQMALDAWFVNNDRQFVLLRRTNLQ